MSPVFTRGSVSFGRATAALALFLATSAGCGFDSLYLSTRPSLGPVHVVDLAGESHAGRVLARTLQGVVNREVARLYLIDSAGSGNPAHRFWLDLYQRDYGVERAWEGDLDGALALFAPEVDGFILASEAEPWTLNAATTFAAIEGVVVGFESQRARLEAVGLRQLDSLVGRWSSALDCYRDLVSEYPRMRHRGIAILAPHLDSLRDFLVQQGLLTIHSWPHAAEWPAVVELLERMPAHTPVYGYLSRDGFEEFQAVLALSQAGVFLVPTDTTPNLSFHVAVRPRRGAGRHAGWGWRPRPPRPVCRGEDVNVSLAISDGDNLGLPLVRYALDRYWNSAKRGRLPIGWSIAPGLRVLAPAAAHHYRTSASAADEWVALLGIGYAYPSFHPSPRTFLALSFAQMRWAGLRVFWTIDPMVYVPDADPATAMGGAWQAFAAAARGAVPAGVLGGYGPHPLFPVQTHASMIRDRWPLLLASGDYPDTPDVLAARIEALLGQAASERPPVTFFSAAVWNNSLDGLVDALEPLGQRGVRFLLPSQALDCVEQLSGPSG